MSAQTQLTPEMAAAAKQQAQFAAQQTQHQPQEPNPARGDHAIKEYLSQFKTSEQILSEYQNKSYNLIKPNEIPGFGGKWIPEEWIQNGKLVGIKSDPEACYFPQPYASHLAAGSTTIDGAIVREIYRKLWYQATRNTSVGLNVVYTESSNTLEMGWLRPNELTFEYPLPIESGIGNIQTLTYWGYGMGLNLGSMSMYITDASMASNQIGQFRSDFMKRQSEAVALSIDNNILAELFSASFGTLHDVATAFKWDGSAANEPDFAQDFGNAHSTLLDNTQKPVGELGDKKYVVAPLVLKPFLAIKPGITQGGTTAASPAVITEGKIGQALSAEGFEMYFTRNATFDNDCIVCYKGADTCIHGTFSGGDIPLMEQERWRGQGTIVTWKRLFNTQYVPAVEGDTTSRNVGIITDIFTD
jgi:hypothetical protein